MSTAVIFDHPDMSRGELEAKLEFILLQHEKDFQITVKKADFAEVNDLNNSLDKGKVAFWWGVNDILDRAEEIGVELNDDQALNVLSCLKRQHDCGIGINWTVIDYHISAETEDATYTFTEDDPVTCPFCGARCDHPDANEGSATCLGCKKKFKYEVE